MVLPSSLFRIMLPQAGVMVIGAVGDMAGVVFKAINQKFVLVMKLLDLDHLLSLQMLQPLM